MNYKRKQMVCDLDKPEEKELWEFMQQFPHGKYSEDSKAYWLGVMRKAKEENNESRYNKHEH